MAKRRKPTPSKVTKKKESIHDRKRFDFYLEIGVVNAIKEIAKREDKSASRKIEDILRAYAIDELSVNIRWH